MVNRIALFLLIFGVNHIHSQITPGGIGTTNLSAWFRADDLSVGDVTAWTTNYPVGPGAITVTDPQAPYPQLTMTPSGAVSNYNNTLFFESNTYAGQNIGTVQGLRNTSTLDLLDNAYAGDQGSFFGAYYMPPPLSGNGHMCLYNETSDGIQMRNLNSSGRIALGLLSSNSINASRDWTEDNRPNVTSYRGNRSGSNTFQAYNKGKDLSATVASQSSSNAGLYFGYSPTIGTSAYNGYLHEFIFFNRDLTDIEMSKVHSYLAIKYGITLDNELGGIYGDYIATNGTLIWDADLNPLYHNDVIGIGRDDVEGLYQRQSHAFDDSVRIYIDILSETNASNAGVLLSDISYVTIGHNAGLLCGTTASNLELPAAVTSRIEREFKLTKTNFSQSFNLDITIDTCSSIEGVDVNKIRLLVDDDGDFTNAQVLSNTDGIAFSVQDGIVTITGISNSHVPNNSTRYITVAYVDSDYSIEGSGAICFGQEGWVVFTTFSGTPISINYSDGTNNYNVPNISNGDSLYLNPSVTTTYSFYSNGALINCCDENSIQQFVLTVNALPTLDITIASDTVCFGGATSLTANGTDTYSWSNGAENGVEFEPLSTTNYVLTAMTSTGCIDSTEIEIVVNPLPIVSISSPINELCYGESIMYEGIGAQTYIWSNGIANAEYFFPEIGTLTYVVEGTDSNGCMDSDSVELTVHPSPSIQVELQNSVCRGNDLMIQVFADMAGNYSWSGGGAVYLNQLYGSDVVFNSPSAENFDINVEFENEFSCSIDTSFLIEVVACDPPIAIIEASTNYICPGEVVQFSDASIGDSIVSWDWQFPGGIPTNASGIGPFDISFAVAGSYDVELTVVNFEGASTVVYTVEVLPCLPPDVNFDILENVLCETHCTQISNNSIGGDTYDWYINGEYQFSQSENSTEEFCFNLEGTYEIVIIGTNIYGTDTNSQLILVNPMPELTYNLISEVIYGDTANISVPQYIGESILWIENTPCQTCFENQVLVLETTEFDYIITNEFGCQDSSYYTVFVEYEDYVDVPDNFSPNSDGVNDVLYVKGLGIESLTFKIFNRYGQVVFKSNSQEEGWDGKVMGFPADDATFVYTVDYTLVNGSSGQKKGFVNLIR